MHGVRSFEFLDPELASTLDRRAAKTYHQTPWSSIVYHLRKLDLTTTERIVSCC